MKLLSRIVFFLTVAAPMKAFAAQGWAKPATGFMEDLETGLVDIGGPVIGIGVIGLGIFMGVSGRIMGKPMAGMILGGAMIAIGPATIRALIS